MSIPLFSTDYLTSPTMFGAISPTTARIMSETGKQIADTIEKNNAKLEAHAKAPQIASLISTGLTSLSGGDMNGFQAISQAQAMGASNPFLANMTRDALSTGARMAHEFMANSAADARLKTANDRQDSLFNRQEESQKAILDRQREQEWNSDVVHTKNEYNKELQKWQTDQENENRTAEQEGRVPRELPKPSAPSLPSRPEPLSSAYGGEATPPGSRKLPFGKQPTQASGAGGLFSLEGDLPAADAPAMSQPVSGAASPVLANTTAPTVVNPDAVQTVPDLQKQAAALYAKGDKEAANKLLTDNKLPPIDESKPAKAKAVDIESKSTAKVGDMIISFPTPKDVPKSSETIPQPGGGSKTFKSEESTTFKDWRELQDSATQLDRSHGGFAKWAAKAIARKDPIDFGTPNKEGTYFPKTVSGEQYGVNSIQKDESKGTETTVFTPIGVPKDAKAAWDTGQKAMQRLADKGLSVTFDKPKYTDEQLQKVRERMKMTVAEDYTKAKTPEEKNQVLQNAKKSASDIGIPEITMDEIKPKSKSSDLSASDVNSVITEAGGKPLSEKEVKDAQKGTLSQIGDAFSSLVNWMHNDEGGVELIQKQIDYAKERLRDPNITPADKLIAVRVIQEQSKALEKSQARLNE